MAPPACTSETIPFLYFVMTVDPAGADTAPPPPPAPTEFDIPLPAFPGAPLRVRLAPPAPTPGAPPPPLVLLFGWYRASYRRLGKYVDVHAAAGCHTACTIAPQGVVFGLLPSSQWAFAVAVATALASVTTPDGRPLTAGGVVLHPFSNGGAFVVRRLVELAAMGAEQRRATLCAAAPPPADVAAADAAVGALWAATAGTLYDSSPVVLSHASAMAACTAAAGLTAGTPGGAGLAGAAARGALAAGLAVWIGTQWVLVGDVPAAFWAVMRDGEPPGGAPAGVAYAYSAADATADTPALEALIAARRRRGGDVRSWRVEEAPHVALLLAHRDAYVAFAGGCVTDWVAAWRARQAGGGAPKGVGVGGAWPPEGA